MENRKRPMENKKRTAIDKENVNKPGHTRERTFRIPKTITDDLEEAKDSHSKHFDEVSI